MWSLSDPTTSDIPLMNAVDAVFPSSKHLSCQFHIEKNMEAKCKMIVHPKEKCKVVTDARYAVMDSPTEGDYVERLSVFEKFGSDFSIFLDYVKSTWLIPHRERFFLAWIDQVMHLGNTTTNRYAQTYILCNMI